MQPNERWLCSSISWSAAVYASPFSFSAQRGAIGEVQRTLILKTFPGFAALTAEQLATLAGICREQAFSAGDQMLAPGEPCDSFFLTVVGDVEIFRDDICVQRLGPRSAVGGLASLTGDADGADARAVNDVMALEVDTQDMLEVFDDNFALATGVIVAMARTIRGLHMALGHATAQPASVPARKQTRPLPNELSLVDRIMILRHSNAIALNEVEALGVLASACEVREFVAGEELWAVGDRPDGGWQLVEGTVACRQPGKPDFQAHGGWLLGGHDMLIDLPRYYRVVAESDGRALTFTRDALLDVMEDYNDLVGLTLKSMANRVTTLLDVLAKHSPPKSSSSP